MEKPADNQHPLHELIQRRWSPRAFADRAVDDKTLCSLFEAARWAPSSFNEQPWNFIVATNQHPDEFQRLLTCLVEFNAAWAQHAPVLMISVAALQFERNAKPNRHALHDVGLAVENLVLQATSLGLVAHQMAGFDMDKARAVYEIPATHEPVAAIALGYPGDPNALPEPLRDRDNEPRTRKQLETFVFSGRWGNTAPLLRAT